MKVKSINTTMTVEDYRAKRVDDIKNTKLEVLKQLSNGHTLSAQSVMSMSNNPAIISSAVMELMDEHIIAMTPSGMLYKTEQKTD